jgi:hypothetical protein
VVEQNTTKALAPTGVLRNPNRRTGGLRI